MKPEISHLQIFRSIAYANIPKKLHRGKLEATSVKCRLLGWWMDETKGYRLENIETLITARDVQFIEDSTPYDIAVIQTQGVAPTNDDLNRLSSEEIAGVKDRWQIPQAHQLKRQPILPQNQNQI